MLCLNQTKFPSLIRDYVCMFPHPNMPGEIVFHFYNSGNKNISKFTLISLPKCEAGKDQDKTPARRSRAPSLAETEEALAQAVWCWAGIAT